MSTIDGIRDFIAGADPIWQWLAVMIAAMIPYVESYAAAAIGVLVGVPVVLAIVAAIVGNIISMLLFVFFADKIRAWRKSDEKPMTPRQERFKRSFDRYGVAGVSLLGQTLLPSQITSMGMVAFGASRSRVILWQLISITLWGVAFGLLALAGVEALRG